MSPLTIITLITVLASCATAISAEDEQMFVVHPSGENLQRSPISFNISDQLGAMQHEEKKAELERIDSYNRKSNPHSKLIFHKKLGSQVKPPFHEGNDSSAETAEDTEQESAFPSEKKAEQSAELAHAHNRTITLTGAPDIELEQSSFANDFQAADGASAFSRTLITLLSSLHLIDRHPAPPSSHPGAESRVISATEMSVKNKPELKNHFGVAEGVAALLALLAAVGAGVAALIAFVIPPLQIANQILAVIAVALFVAYIIEDKHYVSKEYFEQDYYGDYDDFDTLGYYLGAEHIPSHESGYSYSSEHSQSSHGYQEPDRGWYQFAYNGTKANTSQHNLKNHRDNSSHPFTASNVQFFQKSKLEEPTNFDLHESTVLLTRNGVLSSSRNPTLQRSGHIPSVKTVTENPEEASIVTEGNSFATIDPYDSPNTLVSSDIPALVVQSRQGAHSEIQPGNSISFNYDYTGQHSDDNYTTSTEIITTKINETAAPIADEDATSDSEITTFVHSTDPLAPASSMRHFGRFGRPRSLPHPSRVTQSVVLGTSRRVKTAISKFSSLYD